MTCVREHSWLWFPWSGIQGRFGFGWDRAVNSYRISTARPFIRRVEGAGNPGKKTDLGLEIALTDAHLELESWRKPWGTWVSEGPRETYSLGQAWEIINFAFKLKQKKNQTKSKHIGKAQSKTRCFHNHVSELYIYKISKVYGEWLLGLYKLWEPRVVMCSIQCRRGESDGQVAFWRVCSKAAPRSCSSTGHTSIELCRDWLLGALWALQSLSSGTASELKTFWLKAGPWFVPGHAP